MAKFSALLRLNIKAMLSTFSVGGKKRSRSASGIGALVFMGVLACYLSTTYSFLFAQQLSSVGMLPVLMLIMPFFTVVMGVFFTVFAAQGVVFGGKDNDLMLSLPVPSFMLLLSRTFALYIENLVFCVFMLLPAGAAYLVMGGAGGARFAVTLLLCTFFLALLPTLIALVCGFILAWFSSKFARKALFSTLLYFAFFLLLMVGVFNMNRNITQIAAAAETIESGFSVWGLPFVLLKQATCGGSALSLLGLIAICLLPFLAAVWLFAGRYKRIVTGLGAKRARSDYRLGKLSAMSQRKTLLKKEASKYFGTPIYIFNTGFGLIMTLAAAVAALVMRDRLFEFMQVFGEALPVMPILALILIFLMSTVEITACSISLEGKYLWIIKEAPISVSSLFAVKVGFQLLLCLPCLLVATVCLGIAFSVSFLESLLIFICSGVFALLAAVMGLFINLCFPKLDAPNDTVVVKQSASAIVSTLGSMLLVVVGIVLFMMSWSGLGAFGAVALCAVFYGACSAVLIWLLHTKGVRMFNQLS